MRSLNERRARAPGAGLRGLLRSLRVEAWQSQATTIATPKGVVNRMRAGQRG
jgi:hypothetical protein